MYDSCHSQKCEVKLGLSGIEVQLITMFKSFLRKSTVATILLVPIWLNCQTALAADQRNFTLHNESNVDIREVYVSESGDDSWGTDILEADILPQGEATDIVFEDDSSTCLYDLRAVAINGQELDTRQVNLCKISEYSITN